MRDGARPHAEAGRGTAIEVIMFDFEGSVLGRADQDDIISGEVAKNIEEGIADINSGRTHTSDQVKKTLGI